MLVPCINLVGVGNSWTWDLEHAKVYQRFREGKIYILKGVAKFNDIDIDTTLSEYHIDYDFVDYENEIRLFKGWGVLLESIHDEKEKILEKFDPAIEIKV